MLSIFAQNVFFKIIFDRQVLSVLAYASGKQSLSPRLIFKGAVSRQSSSFCLILPITGPQSL